MWLLPEVQNFMGHMSKILLFEHLEHSPDISICTALTIAWAIYEKNSQNVTASIGLVLHLLWFMSHVSCEQSCPLPSWLSVRRSVLQLRMTLERCPDTSAFCARQLTRHTAWVLFCLRFRSRPSPSMPDFEECM